MVPESIQVLQPEKPWDHPVYLSLPSPLVQSDPSPASPLPSVSTATVWSKVGSPLG